ncbi:MAG TPA: hypothetical protein VMR16_03890 [Candidatus Saccharimonadales bacterium]|nr:hypothetical protein [Candidatus Saccharimonadales bacterium]
MAFSSYDDLISEIGAGNRLQLPWAKLATTAPVAATWYHMWPVAGQPTSGALYTGTALNYQRTTDTTTGALFAGGNVSTDTKHLIYQWGMASAGAPPPVLMLVDMDGYYPLTQSASLQSFVNTTGPVRYTSAGQSGLQVALVGAAAGGATASNITALNYVDQGGNAGAMPTTVATAVTISVALPTVNLGARVLTTTGAGPFLPLGAGDTGVRSLTNITFSAANTGLEALVLCRPLATLPLPTALIPGERDLVMQIANLERVYDGACLTWFVFFPTATGVTLTGQVDVAWG